MNEKYAVVNLGKATVVASFNKKTGVPIYQSFEAFAQFQNKYRKEVACKDKNGDPTVEFIPRGTWWLNHQARRQYDGVVYRPDVDEPEVDGELNLWRGFAVDPIKGDKHEPYLEHLKANICNGNGDHYNYLINVMATIVQKRHQPCGVTVVLISPEEGTGKTFVGKHFGHLFGQHCAKITRAEQLTGNFNAKLEFCQVWLSEEVTYSGKYESALKSLITDDTIPIERKGYDSYDANSYLNGFMTSNKPHVIPAGTFARRYFVLNVGHAQAKNKAYFKNIDDDNLKCGGYENLLHFLLNVDLTDFDIENIPQTDALKEQKAHSRDGIDSLIEHLCHDGAVPFSKHDTPRIADTSGTRSGDGFWPWAKSTFELEKGPQGIAMALHKHWGCRGVDSGGKTGLLFPSLHELRKLFEHRHGSQEWRNKRRDWLAAPRVEQTGRGS